MRVCRLDPNARTISSNHLLQYYSMKFKDWVSDGRWHFIYGYMSEHIRLLRQQRTTMEQYNKQLDAGSILLIEAHLAIADMVL
jgi:hypothetical protein